MTWPPPKERVIGRAVKQLTRVRERRHDPTSRTLHFTFPGAPKGRRHTVTFVETQNVPPFEGVSAWFIMEQVASKPWSYWRAVEQAPGPGAIDPQTHAWVSEAEMVQRTQRALTRYRE
jgi:hypothetical protein